jgi:hypothetical protein
LPFGRCGNGDEHGKARALVVRGRHHWTVRCQTNKKHPKALIFGITQKRHRHYKLRRTFRKFPGLHGAGIQGERGINEAQHDTPVGLNKFQCGFLSVVLVNGAEVTLGRDCAHDAKRVTSMIKRSPSFGL